ncbi:MAG: epoxyqueuosine reductase QueH [Clostridiaceae bacterium]|nr:epoxyqueuosine reductase QueH [Clostridiaceae bacterium]
MKLLLHICCAPCAVAVVDNLKQNQDIELSGFFYNPNIHPYEEFQKRKQSVAAMAEDYGIPMDYYDEFALEYWKNSLKGDKASRCRVCYAKRMDETAKLAREKGFDAFTSSLLISPYQDHELIKSLGEQMAQKYGIQFYYQDFRELFRKSQNMARGKGYYMQKFCGCMYSYDESDHPKKPIYYFETVK